MEEQRQKIDNLQETLSKILAKLGDLKNQSKDGDSSWVSKAFTSAIVFIGLGLAKYYLTRHDRQLAKMATELEVQKVRVDYQKALIPINQTQEETRRTKVLIQAKLDEIKGYEKELEAKKDLHDQMAQRIKDLKTWDEINQFKKDEDEEAHRNS